MSNDYSELYAKALEFIDNEDFENGIAKLEQIVSSDPTQHEAWYNMGLAYYRKNDFTNAIKSYKEATKTKPDHYNAWYNMGLAYDKNKDYKNAVISYDKALALNKNHLALLNKGLVEETLGNKDVALQCYEESINLFPEYDKGWLNKGYLLYNNRKFEEAISSLKKIW